MKSKKCRHQCPGSHDRVVNVHRPMPTGRSRIKVPGRQMYTANTMGVAVYGLINQSIESMIVQNHGEDAWEAIVALSGCTEELFVDLMPYDDAITYDLVSAAAQVLNQPSDAILRLIGQHWIGHIGSERFGVRMDIEGRSILAFLSDLDDMHGRVGMVVTGLKPPSFSVTELSEGIYDLKYSSHRKGLAPLVVGILEGLLKAKGTPGVVVWTTSHTPDLEAHVFRLDTSTTSVASI